VIFCQRGAERGDDALHAGLERDDHVEVALDDVHRAGLLDLLPGMVEAVETAALGEHRRLGRVDELRVVVLLQRPGAEGDRAGAGVVDREDRAGAEPVVVAPLALALDDQTGRREVLSS
jgi:hypothetical protein